MKQLLEGKICLCNMLINISPHELRSLATECNMATVLTRGSQNLSYAQALVLCLLLSLHSQMKQQREGKKRQQQNSPEMCQEICKHCKVGTAPPEEKQEP